MLELLLGQIPEAIYFALFMIFTKEIKEKRVIFIILMVIEYLLVMNTQMFSIWTHVIYVILTFLTLKLLYKEKALIIDIFTFGIASLVLIITSLFSGGITMFDFELGVIMSRLLPFIIIIVFNRKLSKIQKIYKLLWNRNDKNKLKMKSATFRCLNIVIFNIMFYAINAGMIYALLIRK